MADSPILIVDDDASIRLTVSDVLDMEGYPVVTAANGAEALEQLEHTPARLVLLDMRMPVMDGWAFCDKRGESRALRHIPLIATSGAEVPESARPAGIDAFLAKPIDLDAFARFAARLAGRKSGNARPTGLLH